MNEEKPLKIRKLTPKECWRLMGFDDEDFEKAEKVNSNTQLYKQAGNSIVVNVLEAILKNLSLNEPLKEKNILIYSSNENYKLYQGNMLNMLEVIEPNSIDSIITDPPYELNFMGKGWDNSGIAFQSDTWEKCYEVLKPGGYLLAFGGSRTFHRIACAIEDAGFEIRDTIMWLYGSGFPKSMSLGKVIEGKQVLGSANVRDIKKLDGEKEVVGGGWNSNEVEQGKRNQEYEQIKTNVNYTTELGKKWNGWGTALKPSFEPIIVARKPFKGSLVDNVIENGVGGINVDECRVGTEKMKAQVSGKTSRAFQSEATTTAGGKGEDHIGRFPANTILTYDETPSDERLRYFYCAKASKKDRDEGLDEFEEKPKTLTENKGRTFNDRCAICGKKFIGSPETICHCENPITDKSKSAMSKNTHPTVKPTTLMQYLIRLVTPNDGVILDPFNGSGSTGKAVMYENRERNKNYKYIGIELTEEYLPISKARIEYVCDMSEKKLKTMQTSIFDFIGEDGNEL